MQISIATKGALAIKSKIQFQFTSIVYKLTTFNLLLFSDFAMIFAPSAIYLFEEDWHGFVVMPNIDFTSFFTHLLHFVFLHLQSDVVCFLFYCFSTLIIV